MLSEKAPDKEELAAKLQVSVVIIKNCISHSESAIGPPPHGLTNSSNHIYILSYPTGSLLRSRGPWGIMHYSTHSLISDGRSTTGPTPEAFPKSSEVEHDMSSLWCAAKR